MTYPPSPWQLQGQAFVTLQPIAAPQAQPLVPQGLELVQVWPDKTLGGLYLARYESGSTLQYHELIVVGGLVRRGLQFGPWVSHIYVDNVDSLAGGREIWGLPKELATFDWQLPQIQVRQGNTVLCTFTSEWESWSLPQQFTGTGFGCRDRHLISFSANLRGQLAWSRARISIPQASPFRWLEVDRPWLNIGVKGLQLVVNVPQEIG